MKPKTYLFIICFLFVNLAYSQRTITGTVADTDSEPLIGVNVVIANSSIGTVTDVDGFFSLAVTADAKSLTFSYVGYADMTKDITSVDVGSPTKVGD